MASFKRWTKKDFRIEGHFTGSRLRGCEHEYVYDIYYGSSRIETGFSSKRKAEVWLGEKLRKMNAIRKAAYDSGKYDGQ